MLWTQPYCIPTISGGISVAVVIQGAKTCRLPGPPLLSPSTYAGHGVFQPSPTPPQPPTLPCANPTWQCHMAPIATPSA